LIESKYETASHSWNLVVNRFSSACNELEAGEVCTFVGPVGFGSGESTQVSKSTRGKNNYMTKDSFDNLYVTDTNNHVIWYYNLSIVDRTVHGIDVPAYSAKIILGNGTRGISPDGKFNSDFKLNYPRDLAFDPVTNSLFVVDYSNHRVVQLLSDGSARRGLCYGNTGNTRAYNESGPALTRGCYAPIGITIDVTNRKIYLAVYGHHNIKEFDVPFLCRRCVVNGIELPHLLNISGKKPWQVAHLLDTMELWRFGDYKNYTSLALLAGTLGIPSPKDDIDGSMVGHVYWEEDDIDRIITYCEKDVVTVAQVVMKFAGMDLIGEDRIEVV
jgi:hypothetical protein